MTTHAACDMFTEDETEAILMVDASNTFNSINRDAFLTMQKYYIHLQQCTLTFVTEHQAIF